jgi:Zn-dependent peptidase ImmA (M78 family)
MNHLIHLKKHWKVSLQAIIYNGLQVGLISSKQVLFLRQQISRNKWRLFEPYDDVIPL